MPSEKDRNYLGVEANQVTISEINAELIILEVFNMYCVHCQAEAPRINSLFEEVNLLYPSGQVKFIGFGAGNTEMETEVFKGKYKVKFPMIPDQDYRVHKALGEPRTPYILIFIGKGPEMDRVLYRKIARPLETGEIISILESNLREKK
ncbi:MAG: TlpA family protein disulfide reductase [Desulfatiglandales bacterium]